MEAKEEEFIRSLMDNDPELRQYYEEHVRLKQRIEELKSNVRVSLFPFRA